MPDYSGKMLVQTDPFPWPSLALLSFVSNDDDDDDDDDDDGSEQSSHFHVITERIGKWKESENTFISKLLIPLYICEKVFLKDIINMQRSSTHI